MSTRYVYFAHDGVPSRRVKIGISVDPPSRMRALDCDLLFAIPCEHDFAPILERTLHQELAERQIHGRGNRGGHTEWFSVDRRLSRLIQCVRLTRRWPWDGTEVIF